MEPHSLCLAMAVEELSKAASSQQTRDHIGVSEEQVHALLERAADIILQVRNQSTTKNIGSAGIPKVRAMKEYRLTILKHILSKIN